MFACRHSDSRSEADVFAFRLSVISTLQLPAAERDHMECEVASISTAHCGLWRRGSAEETLCRCGRKSAGRSCGFAVPLPSHVGEKTAWWFALWV